MALARSARNAIGLDLVVSSLRQDRRSLAEMLEMVPERALIAMLNGPREGLGLLVMSPVVMAGLIEQQTLGRISPQPALPRKPTRTDAAMICGLLDSALTDLEAALETEDDLTWAGGFRYASFLDDPRPLGLLLEDMPYRVLQAELSLAGGVKSGPILLALPADGRGRRPKPAPKPADRGASDLFSAALRGQVEASDAVLMAVIARVTLPLQMVLGLQPGDPVILGTAALDQVDLEAINGIRVAGGKLGQNRGMRAVRMMENTAPAARVVLKPTAAQPAVAAPQMRATGT